MSLFLLQNKMKQNLSCSILTVFVPKLMQANLATVFEKQHLKVKIQTANKCQHSSGN